MSDTAITIIGRIILIPIILGYLILAAHRIKSNWNSSTQRVVVLMIICSIILLISVIIAIPKPVTMVADIIRMTSMLYSMFIAYIILKHIYQNKVFVSILRDPLFTITTIVSLYVVVADLNRNSFGVITDNDPVTMDFFYTTSSLASYVLMSFLSGITLYWIYITASSSKSLIYKARLSTSGIAFLVITICCAAIIINIVLAALGNFTYRSSLNAVYHYGKLVYFPAMFAAIMLPERTMNYLLKPLYRIQEAKSRQTREDIRYLHERMISIVPSVKLGYEKLNMDDMVVEIADARMILWTNVPIDSQSTISPQSEAIVIQDLLNKRTIFENVGTYTAPCPPSNELKHNIDVAKSLKSRI